MDYLNEIDMIPAPMRGAVLRYIEDGLAPGDFLRALFSNDLKGFAMRADWENKHHLLAFVEYMVWYVPHICQGSPEAVDNWVAIGGLKGFNTKQEEE